eukprot:TRINITY_DN339_c0_g1_i10.p1 TRINITY_DN339_c0_g1~~TRINITY_DN339_c0_g1_i10.p1  ORF type:complete len:291 (+),score=93.36 TRINITY_DN339_c0_g1_i10:97-873(+)
MGINLKMYNAIPSKIVPLKWAVKHDPPTVCLIYKRHPKDKKCRQFQIFFHGLNAKTDIEEQTRSLFIDYKEYLNEETVSFEQVRNLVKRLVDFAKGTPQQAQPPARVSAPEPHRPLARTNDPPKPKVGGGSAMQFASELEFDNFDSMNNNNVHTMQGERLFSQCEEEGGSENNELNKNSEDFENFNEYEFLQYEGSQGKGISRQKPGATNKTGAGKVNLLKSLKSNSPTGKATNKQPRSALSYGGVDNDALEFEEGHL